MSEEEDGRLYSYDKPIFTFMGWPITSLIYIDQRREPRKLTIIKMFKSVATLTMFYKLYERTSPCRAA